MEAFADLLTDQTVVVRSGENGGTGTAGDKYTGLDRFGRIVETIWIKGSGEVVQGVYGRNRSSGIDWRRDDEASSIIAMDAYYEYDGLQQVTVWKRGNLDPGSGPPYTGVTSQKQGEDFTYDQTGNWLGDVSDNPNFTQSRTHDVKNQITSITGPSGVIQPDYDNAGNTTLAPSPGSWTVGYTYKWDAWNRLVEIKQGATVIGSYAYDALTRRTRKTVGGVTRDIYYDRQWRSVEEREGSTVKVQHAWSPLDRWTLIRRKRNASGGTLNETLFCLRDYLDPVALANTSGAVVERYNYDPFGTVRIMSAAFGVRGSSSYDWEFLYHGEFRDEESELYNYGYRYLDTQLGRWLSRDPIGEQGGANLYGFLLNNGPGDRDVFGLATDSIRASIFNLVREGKSIKQIADMLFLDMGFVAVVVGVSIAPEVEPAPPPVAPRPVPPRPNPPRSGPRKRTRPKTRPKPDRTPKDPPYPPPRPDDDDKKKKKCCSQKNPKWKKCEGHPSPYFTAKEDVWADGWTVWAAAQTNFTASEKNVCQDKQGGSMPGSRYTYDVLFQNQAGDQESSAFNVVCCQCCRGPAGSDVESRDCRIITHGRDHYGTHRNGEKTWIPPLK